MFGKVFKTLPTSENFPNTFLKVNGVAYLKKKKKRT